MVAIADRVARKIEEKKGQLSDDEVDYCYIKLIFDHLAII